MENERAYLLDQRKLIFSALTSLCDDFKDPHQISIFSAQAKSARVDSLEAQFGEIQKLILQYNCKAAAENRISIEKENRSTNDLLDTIRGAYFKCIDLNKSKPFVSTTQLPNLNLITFNGAIENWTNFITLYDSLVHENVNLTNIQRMHYLRAHLSGEPASLISSFVIDNNNYPLAYEALRNRYQNQRRLATHFLKQILNFDSKHFVPQKFLDVHESAVSALKNLALENLGDFVLFQLCYNNLPVHTQRSFDLKQNVTDVPTTALLMEHLNLVAKTEELKLDISDTKYSKKEERKPTFKTYEKPRSFLGTSSKCFCCNKNVNHRLFECETYTKKSVDDKYRFLRQQKLCFNCLGPHARNSCKSAHTCRVCHDKHHTSLHAEVKSAPYVSKHFTKPVTSSFSTEEVEQPSALSCVSNNRVLLGTAKAWVTDAYGQYHLLRIVVDPGSQVSVITESCATKLNLRKAHCNLEISGISNAAAHSKGSVQCALRSIHGEHTVPVTAFVLENISNTLPASVVPTEVVNRFKNLKLADPSFNKPQPIDMLVNAEFYCSILSSETPNIISGSPTAIKTTFGWLIMGNLENSAAPKHLTSLFVLSPSLKDTLKKFWEIEEPALKPIQSVEDKYVEEHFVATHRRDGTGRYIVTLPFKPNASPVSCNSESALQSYKNLEKRLSKKLEVKTEYNNFLQVYLEHGHMELAKQLPTFVLPHHCVFKASSSSTKIRVVFNGSAPDPSGVSLNQRLSSGPKLQQDISDMLLAWRFLEIPLVCDIRMMYRQILLEPENCRFQNIYWRPQLDSEIQLYQLNTVTYGLAPSAYQAQRVLHQLVSDEGTDYPLASHALLYQTYVDDIVTGANSVEECLNLYKQLQTLMSKGGFELRKWSSTNLEVLSQIPEEHQEVPISFLPDEAYIKILGLTWEPDNDSFRYSVQAFTATVTKRTVLSYVARIFDPLGWLSPIVFWVKYFIQKLWLDKLDWDSPLTDSLHQQWLEFSLNIKAISKIRIYRPINSASNVRLIGFCDASERGYSALFYLRTSHAGQVAIHLLKAKSKVAPLKTISLPRLELCGAHLLAKLLDSIRHLPSLPSVNTVHLFSDSTIALAWIKTEPYLLKTFVANRVSEIQNWTQNCVWSHVASEHNPADISSRGISPNLLPDCSLWWNGPTFLKFDISDWPPSNYSEELIDLPEVKKSVKALFCAEALDDNPLWQLILRTSSYTHLIRVTCYFRRFVLRLLHQEFETTNFLSACELESAVVALVKVTQQRDFAEDFERNAKKLPMSTGLQKLAAFLSEDGLLKVGGRLRNSNLSERAKHPLLLKKDSPLSKLICRYYHIQYLHAGPDVLLSIIRQKFWILAIRSLLRQTTRQCRNCLRLRASTLQPFMSDLPSSRVQVSRVFSSVATDFCGPFTVKDSTLKRSRHYKGYLCVFICMAVKAVHLEFVSSLSTESFLAAFNRFVSRRALPSDVYSDCGRNYIGASRQLREVQDFFKANSDALHSSFSSRGVTWHFNPPHAPNFGGLWEAAVKSAKTLLYRSLGETCLTFEEYCTLFARIEAILNSRPLTNPSSSPQDGVDYLTPAHFLVGSSLNCLPELPISENLSLHCRWTRVKQLSQHFWHRWSTEYLHTLMQRNKWIKHSPNLSVGTLVYVSHLNSSPLTWPLGCVVEVLPGQDNVVRVAKVRTANGVFVRPVNKLVALPNF